MSMASKRQTALCYGARSSVVAWNVPFFGKLGKLNMPLARCHSMAVMREPTFNPGERNGSPHIEEIEDST